MAEEDSPELIAAVTEALALISRELDDAAAICVEAGFELPPGIEEVPYDAIERLRWNYHFVESARAWTEGDPDWCSIGAGPRLAVELMDAGVRIQIAAHGMKDMPLTGALGLHGYSVAYGSWRAELSRWKRGEYAGAGQGTFAEIIADVGPLQEASDTVTGDLGEALARLGQRGGTASGEARRWWWPTGLQRAREWRAANRGGKTADLARLLKREFERHYPEGRDLQTGKRLPSKARGYRKAIETWEAEGTLDRASP
ncbi:hypothetical protein [Phenylobacterium sp.]|uniref:hypothetical protein n=1 Tax=Phenylobacterium sp. TaxID=1871053 RepID=UPI003BA9C039